MLGAALLPWRVAITTGRSMEPTLRNGQPFVFARWDEAGSRPLHHGDVVVLRLGSELCVKRLLALGGEHFWALGRAGEALANCRLLPVNTPPLAWTRRFPTLKARKVRVPADCVFVVGDSPVSCDSRHYGPVLTSQVLGRLPMQPGSGEEGLSNVAWTQLPPRPGRPG
jgi:signal peptidase I